MPEATMARTKSAASPKPPASLKTIGMKASPEWAAWLEMVATRNRTSVAALVDQAVTAYARELGVSEPPPERTP
jgi:hypothetical protein